MVDDCATRGLSTIALGFYAGGAGAILGTVVGVAGNQACVDLAVLHQKAMQYDCLQPDCPGFDPKGRDGPCAGSPPGLHCCPEQSLATGYVLCSECCSPSGNGCGAGVTECGGG